MLGAEDAGVARAIDVTPWWCSSWVFTLLANFFYSQALPIAARMLVALLGLLTALVNAHMPVGRPPFRRPCARRRT